MSRTGGSIIQLDTALKPAATWNFVRGWPVKWEIGEFDASKSELAIENLEIADGGPCLSALYAATESTTDKGQLMANETEPRALSAALAAPAFVTRAHGVALHAANRHVERWAPEAGANRVRSMRSLGFVDRLVAPWMETAQRSASLRLLNQYAHTGLGER